METEAVLEKVWELHDKVSDAIHAITRAHFLRSVKAPRGERELAAHPEEGGGEDASEGTEGFAIIKDLKAEEGGAAMAEARSLSVIRSALENLEGQLQFFHTVQSQQQAVQDAAIRRLEQSRAILAIRLANHQGKKCKVIEEAMEFVGDVHETSQSVAPLIIYEKGVTRSQPGKNSKGHRATRPNMLMRMFISNFFVATKSLVRIQGVLGKATIVALGMLALLQLNQVAFKSRSGQARDQTLYRKRNGSSSFQLDSSSRNRQFKHFDVSSARG